MKKSFDLTLNEFFSGSSLDFVFPFSLLNDSFAMQRKKTLEQARAESEKRHDLKRTLGRLDLYMIGAHLRRRCLRRRRRWRRARMLLFVCRVCVRLCAPNCTRECVFGRACTIATISRDATAQTAGVGSTIGAGIFVLTGVVAREYAGPAICISFLLSGLAIFFSAMCYAELAARVPISGSAYSYAVVTIGEFPAFLVREKERARARQRGR